MPLLAVVLICSLTLPSQSCTVETAQSVARRPASSELTCLTEAQQLAAEMFGESLKGSSYVRIDCRRGRAS